MVANYHFHIHNFVNVNNSQIQNHSPDSQLHAKQKVLDTNSLKDILLQLQQVQQEIHLDQDSQQAMKADIKTIHSQLNLKKPRLSIIKDCICSITAGLENVAGHVLVADLLAKINLVLGHIK